MCKSCRGYDLMCVRMQVVYWNLCSSSKSYVEMCVDNVHGCVRHVDGMLECVYVI